MTSILPRYTDAGANLSDEPEEDGGPLYRYRLWRTWDGLTDHRVTWLMLNPSTADGRQDDNTIRRCVGLAHSWGYGGIDVGNLFAWRARHPRDLPKVPGRAVGPDAELWLTAMIAGAEHHDDPPSGRIVVAGWGSHPSARLRAASVAGWLHSAGVPIHSVGVNADNAPTHPLFVERTVRPHAWRML